MTPPPDHCFQTVVALDVYAYAKATNRNGAYDAYIDSVKGRFARSPRTPATPTP